MNSTGLGWLSAILSALGMLLMSPVALGFVCVILISLTARSTNIVSGNVLGGAWLAITVGLGAVFWHSRRALQGKPSACVRLPRAWVLAAGFGVCVFIGVTMTGNVLTAGLIAPPLILIAAAIPPLAAVAWFAPNLPDALSWRRGTVAFVGGATASVALAFALEIILPFAVLVGMLAFGNTAIRGAERLLSEVIGGRGAQALTSSSFVYAFIHGALIAPLAEEIVKPLIVLPLIRRLERREAFLVAAFAGAGFAALENILYASAATGYWAGLLIVRGIGGAVHPLGAGLVGLAWRDLLRREHHAWRNGLARFGLAVGLHALWNGGSLIVFALLGAQFFGKPPPALNLLGFSAAGLVLAFLIVLGLATFGVGRSVAENTTPFRLRVPTSFETQFTVSDRAVAIWALVWLALVVPLGIAVLRALFR